MRTKILLTFSNQSYETKIGVASDGVPVPQRKARETREAVKRRGK